MEFKTILLILILWTLLVVIQSLVHVYLIKVKKKKPVYLYWFFIRGTVALIHCSLFLIMNFWVWVVVFLFQLCSHFVVFNPLTNLLLGKEFTYLGKESGWFDKLFYDDRKFYVWFYITTFVVMIIDIAVIFDIYL